MAEYAQKAIEEMLPEIDRMRRIGLFSDDEIRAIMKKRKRFEYKTQRRTKEKEVYLQYIQYEISVQQLVKLRREKKGIEVEKDRIEKPMALRIYRLFRMACFRFKHDVKLWLTHIDFAKKNFDRERVSKLFTTMLKIHNKKPNLWIMAAKFEFEVNESVETARQLFQRGLRLLPDKKKIWLEYFKMELMCVDLIMKRKELLGLNQQSNLEATKGDETIDSMETNNNNIEDVEKKVEDSILSCKIVEVVFLNAIKQLKKNGNETENEKEKIDESIPDFVHNMIKIAYEFEFTESLVDRMYKFIEEDCTLNKYEGTWNVLARRNLLQEESILRKCEETGQCADFTIAEFEDKTNVLFLKAIDEIKTEEMHKIYLDFCIERLKLGSSFLNDERFKRLNDAFIKAQSEYKSLPLDYIIEWIQFLIKFNKDADAVKQIQNELAKNCDCVRLWNLYLNLTIEKTDKSNESDLVQLFYESIKAVKQKDSLDLWQLMINYCLLNNSQKTEDILKEGSQIMIQEISSFCRSKYLLWSLSNSNRNENAKSLTKVRQIYQSLRQLPPFSADFFNKYIEIEKCATKLDDSKIIAAYEDALNHFGRDNLELWISYIEFMYRKSTKNHLEEVGLIYWRAMKALGTSLIDEFTQKFCLLKINLDEKHMPSEKYDFEMDK